jgi:hypothetical protein
MQSRKASFVNAFLLLAKEIERQHGASAASVTSAILTAALCRATDDDLTRAKATMLCPAARSRARSCSHDPEETIGRHNGKRRTNCFGREEK